MEEIFFYFVLGTPPKYLFSAHTPNDPTPKPTVRAEINDFSQSKQG
jgi:hypothetical protein